MIYGNKYQPVLYKYPNLTSPLLQERIIIMKKILSIVIVIVLFTLLSACGESEAERQKRIFDEAGRQIDKSDERINELEREIEDLERLQDRLESYYP